MATIKTETDREKALRLGEAVRTARIEFGWSLGDIARSTGVRTSYLSSIERGRIPLNEIRSNFCGIMIAIIDSRGTENGNCKNNN